MKTTHPRFRLKANSGFTLIEILVVIGIIAVLATLVFPMFSKMQQRGASAKAANSAKLIGMANISYAGENNNQLLGWGTANNWNDDVELMRQMCFYLTGNDLAKGTGAAAVNQIAAGLKPFVDPLVPNAFNKYSGKFPWTWSINSIFNRKNGRNAEGLGTWVGAQGSVNPRRLVEFDKPSETIYAVSGGYQFNQIHAANEALLKTPEGRQPIFYYHGTDESTPAVFLDGHVEMMRFPIPLANIIPGS